LAEQLGVKRLERPVTKGAWVFYKILIQEEGGKSHDISAKMLDGSDMFVGIFPGRLYTL
jgi:hypothetical protein